jgi:hypothetical protein
MLENPNPQATLHVLDDAVETLGASVGDPELQEDEDVRPPRLDRGGEPSGLRHVGVGAGLIKPVQPLPDQLVIACGEELA